MKTEDVNKTISTIFICTVKNLPLFSVFQNLQPNSKKPFNISKTESETPWTQPSCSIHVDLTQPHLESIMFSTNLNLPMIHSDTIQEEWWDTDNPVKALFTIQIIPLMEVFGISVRQWNMKTILKQKTSKKTYDLINI
jgi:hypothetical protein